MTLPEIVRIICYVISAPTFLYVALGHIRRHDYVHGLMALFLSALFVWYMVEITLASSGINTREYRIIGTPMIIGITVCALWLAIDMFMVKRSVGAGVEQPGGES